MVMGMATDGSRGRQAETVGMERSEEQNRAPDVLRLGEERGGGAGLY